MIEIAIDYMEQKSIAQALERVSLGEQLLLSSNGKTFVVLPAEQATAVHRHNPKASMKDVFAAIKIKLPSDYKFDREEANSR